MGRLIDIDKARKEYSNLTDLTMSDTTLLLTLFDVLDNAPTIEAIPKADYEARLRADMAAMLEDLKLEIEEVPKYCMTHDSICVYRKAEEYISDVNNLIQQKINALKADRSENE